MALHAFLDTLIDEHERILDALTALHDYARFYAPNDEQPRESLRAFAAFFRDYVDEWHHHKEEDLLFTAMFDAGFPRHSGPVACMNHEHEDGRAHVRALVSIADGAGPLSVSEVGTLVQTSADYARMLANHIAKENQMLYPMAQRALGDDALDLLAARVSELRRTAASDYERSCRSLVERFSSHRLSPAIAEAAHAL